MLAIRAGGDLNCESAASQGVQCAVQCMPHRHGSHYHHSISGKSPRGCYTFGTIRLGGCLSVFYKTIQEAGVKGPVENSAS